MKKTLLIGLAAVALGSMTACSNILEEEGIVSPSAKTGDLTIGVAQSPINVITKAGTETPFDIQKYINDVKVTLSSNIEDITQPTGTTLPVDAKYSDIISTNSTLTYKVNTKSTYKLTASLEKMDSETSFGFDLPNFSGTKENITVYPNTTTEATVSCTLSNSIISIDLTGLTPTENNAVTFIPTSLVLKNENSSFSLITNGSKVSSWSDNAILFAKENIPAKIELKGYLSNDTQRTEITTGDISIGKSNGEGNTVGNTKYDIKYALNGDEGKLQLLININNLTEVVTINVTVNPYDDNKNN